jgi:hypothetical protein
MTSPQRVADAVRERAEAFERFAVWEVTHPIRLSPSAALEAIGALYELLPPSGRRRPVDPAGVMALRETLSILSR